jgi:hypothetical protein
MEIKQNFENEVFSLFDRAVAKEPTGFLSITDFASIVCDPKKGGNRFIEAARIIEEIRLTNDQEEQRRLKLLLPAITPGVKLINNRQNIESYTGLMQVDIDKGISDPEKLRNEIGGLSWVLLSALSVRRGVWFLVRIPEPEKQADYWLKVNEFLKKKFNIEADESRKNPKDLRFFAPDKGVVFNQEARQLNMIPQNSNFPTPSIRKRSQKPQNGTYLSPIDDFKENAEVIPMLIELGYKIYYQHGNKTKFTRPGKNKGTSSEWDEKKRLFYDFSSNSNLHDVNPGRSLSALDIYMQLKQISLIEAREQLRGMGWGRDSKKTNKS